MAGRLIAIEGGEGAGKSTQAVRLAKRIGAELTREPGGTALGEQIRGLLLGDDVPLVARAELFLALAARAEHLAERIVPALDSGSHVVVDRFSGSTIAYQGYGRGLSLDEVKKAVVIATGGRSPDLNILLDLPVAVGQRRRTGAADRIEGEDAGFHESVREGFLAQASEDPDHWAVLDASAPVEVVEQAVYETVADRLGLRGEHS